MDKAFREQFTETKFWRERPLQIKGPEYDTTLVGFKEPWTKARCKTAIEQRQMYEAAINIDWLKTLSAADHDRVIAGDQVTYDDIENVRCSLMVIEPDVLATAVDGWLPKESRRYFSFVLACYVDDESHLDRDAFEHQLCLLDGHAIVWAWWLQLFHLLSCTTWMDDETNTIALRQHLDMGLGATAQVRVESDKSKLAIWSTERARTREVVAQNGHDTFPAFVRKVNIIVKDIPAKQRQEHLRTFNILYDGALVNHKMYYSMVACAPLIDGHAGEVLAAIQAEFGKKVLAKGYTKLYNIARSCGKVAAACTERASDVSAAGLFDFILEGLLFELRSAQWEAETLSEAVLKTKTSTLILKYLLLRYFKKLLREAA